jgi:hypothetical protein
VVEDLCHLGTVEAAVHEPVDPAGRDVRLELLHEAQTRNTL